MSAYLANVISPSRSPSRPFNFSPSPAINRSTNSLATSMRLFCFLSGNWMLMSMLLLTSTNNSIAIPSETCTVYVVPACGLASAVMSSISEMIRSSGSSHK